MSFTQMLEKAHSDNHSMLCVGLDPEPSKFPTSFIGKKDAIFDFCTSIVDATHDLAIAFKPQIAYFAAHQAEDQLARLIRHIKRVAPHIPVILDAKRGDIGATSQQYAVEAFERYEADAVTLSPFMGFDSIEPYLKYKNKGVFLLCRTSNKGGDDFQNLRLADKPGNPTLYEYIAQLAERDWNTSGQLGLVVGATYPTEISKVRAIAPSLPLLIPGVGAQGGDAVATVRAGMTKRGAVLINSSRAILYASQGSDFEASARTKALETRDLLNAATLDNHP